MKPLTLLPFAAIALPAWMAGNWLALTLASLALVALAASLLLRTRRPPLAFGLGVAAVALALLAAGGLLLRPDLGGWVALGALGALVLMLGLLGFTGVWSREAALALAAVGLVGLGGLSLAAVGTWAVEGAEDMLTMSLRSPWWLLLLLAIPVIVVLSWPRLNRDELRPWVATGLRVLGVGFLAFALAEPYVNQTTRAMTVLFVVDRSLSIPEEPGKDALGNPVDLRLQRVRRFLTDAVRMRGAGHERDKAGLIVFGRRPRLEFPPSEAPYWTAPTDPQRTRFPLVELPAADDGQYTDIEAALKLALASFADGSNKRIVLVSDGAENLGKARDQAALARAMGAQIDILPLAAGRRNTDEVLVERVSAPEVIEQGARVRISVVVRSHNPNTVVGRLILRQITEKEGTVSLPLGEKGGLGLDTADAAGAVKGAQITRVARGGAADRAGLEVGEVVTKVGDDAVNSAVDFHTTLAAARGRAVTLTVARSPIKIVGVRPDAQLEFGLNTFVFERPLGDEQRSYSYEAEFQPLEIRDRKGQLLQRGLPGDRVQNNRAATHVIARGQGRILLLENKAGDHAELVRRLIAAGKNRFQVVAEPVELLENYREAAKLAVYLSNFDCIILANVPADRISEEHQEVIRANTHDQGCGLVMIGGPESFGAGGWQNTPVEKALPVDCDLKSLKVQGKGGLVLIMHACEMANGNMWQKKIAKLALERLGPSDEIGIIDFGFPAAQWQVPMMEVGPNKAKILAKIDAMSPGDMPDFDPTLQMAHAALTDKKKDFGAKHVIIISDGDPNCTMALLPPMKADKITITTVGIATHGANEDNKMAAIAKATGGRYYGPNTNPGTSDPKKLPAIYIKESRLVSQAFLSRKRFLPQLQYRAGPTAKLPELPSLQGYVRTTPKPSNFVELPILSPREAEQDFPILAHWHYGLGKAVAFTSDAGRPELWCRDWIAGEGEGIFAAFWEQVLGWALRPTESGRLIIHRHYDNGKIRITVEARDRTGKPDTSLNLRGGLTRPGGGEGRRQELRFVQKNSGQYEAEIKAEEAGSYFLTAQATRTREVLRKGEKKPLKVEEGVDSVRAGVTVSYSPEFAADLEGTTALLDYLMTETGGRAYADDEEALQAAARDSVVFRPPTEPTRSRLPFHYWLLFCAAGLLLVDVAVRRLAFSAEETSERAQIMWARLRGFALPPPRDAVGVERIRARPAEVVTSGDRGGRRFEAAAGATGGWVDATAAPARPAAPAATTAPGAPEPEAAAGDQMDALLAAKKRAVDERKKE